MKGGKGKERKSIYIAPYLYTMYISKHSGMDHTVLPANTPCLSEEREFIDAAIHSEREPQDRLMNRMMAVRGRGLKD